MVRLRCGVASERVVPFFPEEPSERPPPRKPRKRSSRPAVGADWRARVLFARSPSSRRGSDGAGGPSPSRRARKAWNDPHACQLATTATEPVCYDTAAASAPPRPRAPPKAAWDDFQPAQGKAERKSPKAVCFEPPGPPRATGRE